MIYTMEVEQSPSFDEGIDWYNSCLVDLKNSLISLLGVEEVKITDGKFFEFETQLNIGEIKKIMKPVFSYHIDDFRMTKLFN